MLENSTDNFVAENRDIIKSSNIMPEGANDENKFFEEFYNDCYLDASLHHANR